jgi:tripartite ATP-independent transporter DctM subunit
MSDSMAVLLTLGLVSLGLFLLSVPISFALGLSSLLVMVLWPGQPFLLAVQQVVGGIDSFPLLAVPFFLLAAAIMNSGGITDRIISVFDAVLGRARGALAMVDVTVNIFMAGISGSGVADCTATGSVLIPAMKKNGYPAAFAAALTAAAAVCGPIIPPSIPMVIYGMVARVSILELFVGGYIPGLMLGGCLLVYVWYIARRRGFPSAPKVAFGETARRFQRGFWALMMPVILVAGIVLGVFTVTELGAVLCFYAILVSCVIYREFKVLSLTALLRQVGLDAANVIFIVGVSSLFSYLLTIHHIPELVESGILAITHSKFVLLLLINVVFLIAGMFIDSTPATLILVPIFLPVSQAFGIDPAHLGVVIVFNLCIGLVTPPVALNLYITSRIADASVGAIVAEGIPLFAILMGVLIFISYVPETVLWLPGLFGLRN